MVKRGSRPKKKSRGALGDEKRIENTLPPAIELEKAKV